MFSIRSFMSRYYFADKEQRFIERVIGKYRKIHQSEVSTNYSSVMPHFEEACFSLEFNELLDMLEAIINDIDIDDDFGERIGRLFELHGASYWLDTSLFPYRFIPSTSQEQGEATRQAIQTVEQSGIAAGATTHLRKATEHLNAGRYADSISDSIHAH